MELVLVLSLEGLNYYGYIPETFQAKPGQTESFELTEGDEDLLDKDFIGPIDRLCNSLIDPGDVDYLNAEQCKLMLGWLEWRLTEPINHGLKRSTASSSSSPTRLSSWAPALSSISRQRDKHEIHL